MKLEPPMHIKTTDDYQNQRLELLMKALGNDRLEGEICPRCFKQCPTPELLSIPLPRFHEAVFANETVHTIEKGRVREALREMRQVKSDAVLNTINSPDELIKEYVCARCGRSYVGELNLIANLSATRGLSFIGYDESKSYKEDFYSFSVLDSSYNSFVQEMWDEDVEPYRTITPLMIQETDEDNISGEVLGMLKRFFLRFQKEIFADIGAIVNVYSIYHAGTVEAGRREGVPAGGADVAIWLGPLTKEEAGLVEDYVNQVPGSRLPVMVGNGVILQGKKQDGGKVDRKQIDDLIRYASIEYKEHEYRGVPGKLFINYAVEPPFVIVLSCDYTYQLYRYSKQLPDAQKTMSFPASLLKLQEHTAPVDLREFVQLYL